MRKSGGFVVGMLVLMLASAVGPVSWARDKKAKARAYYFEGLKREMLNEPDAAYEYYRRAAELDPSNREAAYNLGLVRMSMRNSEFLTDEAHEKSLALMSKYVDAFPDDVDEGVLYGYMRAGNDTTGEGIRVFERIAERNPDQTSVLIYLSQAYSQAGESRKAIEAMDRYEALEGISPTLSLHKISLYLQGKDSIGAVGEADRLIASNPKNYKSYVLKGNLFEVLEKPDSAKPYYEMAEVLAPEKSEPKIALMDVYRQRGDSAEYDKKVYEVLLTEDMEVEAKTQLLGEYLNKLFEDSVDMRRGDYLFSVLQEQYPHEPAVLNLSARYLFAKGNPGEAAEQIGYAVDLEPTNSDYRRQMMFYLAQSGDYAGAVKAYRRARQSNVADRNMSMYAAALLQETQQYDSARSIYKSLVAAIDSGLQPDSAITLASVRRDISLEDLDFLSQLYTAMGDAAYSAKDTLRAYRDYDNALELNPDNAMAANNLAYFTSTNGGDLERAAVLSRKSLEGDNSNNPTFLDTYAWILYLQGKYEEALEYQQKAVEEMKERGYEESTLYSHYADILEKNGRGEEAKEFREKAATLEKEEKKK